MFMTFKEALKIENLLWDNMHFLLNQLVMYRNRLWSHTNAVPHSRGSIWKIKYKSFTTMGMQEIKIKIFFYSFSSKIFRRQKSWNYVSFLFPLSPPLSPSRHLSTKNRVLFFAENWNLNVEDLSDGSLHIWLKSKSIQLSYDFNELS